MDPVIFIDEAGNRRAICCRGGTCDTLTACGTAGCCLYKSSAEEAREVMAQSMPLDSKARKNTPLVTGVLDYFPAALAAVARLSKFGNDKHNPGQPLHWSRDKSADHADCIGRHLADRGIIDPETGMSHTVEVAWRALALLQEECERQGGSPKPRGAR